MKLEKPINMNDFELSEVNLENLNIRPKDITTSNEGTILDFYIGNLFEEQIIWLRKLYQVWKKKRY